MRKYFYTDGVTKIGPFSKEELKTQNISRITKIWYFGLANWTELSKITELNDIISTIPPELKSPNTQVKKDTVDTQFKQDSKPNPIPIKASKIPKWKRVLGIVVLLFITFIVIKIVRNKSEAKLYKEVVANSYEADENFEIYVDKFYRDLEYYGIFPKKPKTTIIKFSRLDQLDNATHIHGLSFGHNDDNRIEIYINPSSWKRFTKPMKYFLMYHELAHDVLNLDDLDNKPLNEDKLMYPEISSYEKKNMDDFIDSFHTLFEEQAKKWK